MTETDENIMSEELNRFSRMRDYEENPIQEASTPKVGDKVAPKNPQTRAGVGKISKIERQRAQVKFDGLTGHVPIKLNSLHWDDTKHIWMEE